MPTGLRIHAVCFWIRAYRSFLHATSEDSDQTGWMQEVFTGRSLYFVEFIMSWLLCLFNSCIRNDNKNSRQRNVHTYSVQKCIFRNRSCLFCYERRIVNTTTGRWQLTVVESIIKVRKTARIRNRYYQASHLFYDKVTSF